MAKRLKDFESHLGGEFLPGQIYSQSPHPLMSCQTSAFDKLRKFKLKPPVSKIWTYLGEEDSRHDETKERASVFFHRRIFKLFDGPMDKLKMASLLKCAVDLGKLARKSDKSFCEAMNQEGHPTRVVYHGECALLKLTDRFIMGRDQKFYTFVKLQDYDKQMSMGDLGKLLSGEKIPSGRLVRMTGPAGAGKSFYLQYVLRHIRNCKNLCALYLANPAMFLGSTIDFVAIFLELVFSLAAELDQSSELFELLKCKADEFVTTQYSGHFSLLETTIKEVTKMLHNYGKSLVIVLDQENAYEADKSHKDLCTFLCGKEHGAYVISSVTYTSDSLKSPDPTVRIIRYLSDLEIIAILESRCCPRDRYLLTVENDNTRGSKLLLLNMTVSVVGRCPLDIHDFMRLEHARGPEVTTIPWRVKRFKPKVENVEGEHSSFFMKLSESQQEAFLILLAMVDKAPPIGSEGYCVYEYLRSEPGRIPAAKIPAKFVVSDNDEEDDLLWQACLFSKRARGLGTPTPEDEICAEELNTTFMEMEISDFSSDCADDTVHQAAVVAPAEASVSSFDSDKGEDFVNIDLFKRILGFETFASIENATSVLDGRYFFIDRNRYVRPFSLPAFKAIKDYHERKDGKMRLYLDLFRRV